MPLETAIPSRSAPTITAEFAARFRILADDVTGACDSGAAFLAAGHSVRVWFGATQLFPAPETVQAFHTGSRYLPAGEAAEVVARAAAGLERDAHTILFKKVDSAGRGPIAAEVLAAHRALGTRAILFAPAFPAAGRRVCGGILEIRDASGQDAQVSLPELFAPELRAGIALLKTAGEVARAMECGKTLLLCDSASQGELNAFARAAEPLHGLLYAGSAGLARAIASLHPAPAPDAPAAAAARTLVIAGTPHSVTKLQLDVLESAAQEREDTRILRIACEDGDEAKIRAAFEAFEPDALILTGGHTAQMAAHALGAHSALLCGEFAPGIPWGRLEGGAAQGRIAVTKSGGFGSAVTLVEIIAKLSGAA